MDESPPDRDRHIRREAAQLLGDAGDFIPGQMEGGRQTHQRRLGARGIRRAEAVPLRVEIIDDARPQSPPLEIVGQMHPAQGGKVPNTQQTAALLRRGLREGLPGTQEIKDVQVGAETVVQTHHSRKNQFPVNVEPIQRQPRILLVIDDFRLADEDQIIAGHTKILRASACR
jgi:hypothetical protein